VFEGPAADGAGERTLLGMNPAVHVKVFLNAESFVAIVAAVGRIFVIDYTYDDRII